MRKQVFFLSVGLILLALCSCDKSMQNETETNATMAKVKKRATTGVRSFELGNFVVNPALDDEFQLSEAEIVEELMSYGFLDSGETMDITPIYFEDVIPTFFKSLIVEPESNEWYGINADEVLNMYRECPSIAFYIINTLSGKAFLTTADRRYGCNLIEYRKPANLDPEIVTIYEDVVNELYDSGAPSPFPNIDSIVIDRYHSLLGIRDDADLFQLKKCFWQFQVNRDVDILPCSSPDTIVAEPLLPEDLRWGQRDIFGDCDHDIISGSITISILKILCFHGYSGAFLDGYFESTSCSNMDVLSSYAGQLYEDVSAVANHSQRGFDILTSCGFDIFMDDGEMTGLYAQIDLGKLVIDERKDGSWQLIDGYMIISPYCLPSHLFERDKNGCERNEKEWDWTSLYNAHYYEY